MKKSMIREFHELIQQYSDGIDLTIGELSQSPHQQIIEKTYHSLIHQETHYAPTQGEDEFITKIIEVEKIRGIDVHYSQVLITQGASEAMACCILSCLNAKDKVVALAPAYPQYRNLCELVDAHLITCEIEQLPYILNDEVKMLIINTPHNPTGKVIRIQDLKLNHWQGMIILDEVYADINYIGYQNLYSKLPNAILIRSFSKTYAMSGFRLGYLICDECLCEKLTLTHQSLVSCLPTFIQKAGIEALNHQPINIADLKKRRDYIQAELMKLKIPFDKPEGTFYFWLKIPDSKTFCYRLLKEKHVALTPSEAFDQSGYVRLSYGGDFEQVKIALRRIAEFIQGGM